jgi:tRNA(Ile)-lysidine synthase
MDQAESKFLQQAGALLPRRGTLVVGVSGGADSVALLELLARTLPDAGRRLAAVHVHHGLRGRDADRDQAAVIARCRTLGLPCAIYRRQVQQEARRYGRAVEAAGRAARQECFLDAAALFHARAVVLAHHQDDQAETLFLNLLRGAGGRGLAGLRPVRAFPHPQAPSGLRVIRPLLSFSRSELQAYLRRRGLSWRLDRSNLDPAYARNRLRLRVLPGLERNLGFRPQLARSAEILARDDAYLDQSAERALVRLARPKVGQALQVSRAGLRRLPEALRWRVLSLIWDRLGIPEKTTEHLREIAVAVSGPAPAGNLPGRWTLQVRGDDMAWLPPAGNEKLLHPFSGFGVECVIVSVPRNPKVVPRAADYALVDAGKIMQPLAAGSRIPGESMQPLGLGGRRKDLKKIFSEMRLPVGLRDYWPIIRMGGQVVWIFRGPVAEPFKVEPETKKALKITVFQKSPGPIEKKILEFKGPSSRKEAI